jgi:RNA recognition motif-containing protein
MYQDQGQQQQPPQHQQPFMHQFMQQPQGLPPGLPMGPYGMMPMQAPPGQFPPRLRPQRGAMDPTKPQIPRSNEIGDSSRVIHMRNVTPEVSQLSIQNLVQSFGRIRNIVMLRQKNQALVEMESQQSAQQLVDFFKDPGFAEIDGRRVYVRFSNHQELTATQHTSKTLLVSMFNTQYDVSAAAQITPSIVYQIFGSYGTVEKIVVLPKNDSSAQNHNRVQALVQFENKEVAETVKNTLQGQPVTLGETVTFTLDIQFSKMEEIKASSPHNSLVIPKGATPQQSQQLAMQQHMASIQHQQQQQHQQFLMSQHQMFVQDPAIQHHHHHHHHQQQQQQMLPPPQAPSAAPQQPQQGGAQGQPMWN